MPTHKSVTASFARPANTTAYASGDIVANNAAGASVVAVQLAVSQRPGRGGQITRVMLAKTSTSLTAAAFRVHLFAALPAVTSGDNAALAAAGVAAGYLGAADITMSAAFTDGAYGAAAVAIDFRLPAGATEIFALVEARDVYTPASAETFKISLAVVLD
jgi:hypothetical protein